MKNRHSRGPQKSRSTRRGPQRPGSKSQASKKHPRGKSEDRGKSSSRSRVDHKKPPMHHRGPSHGRPDHHDRRRGPDADRPDSRQRDGGKRPPHGPEDGRGDRPGPPPRGEGRPDGNRRPDDKVRPDRREASLTAEAEANVITEDVEALKEDVSVVEVEELKPVIVAAEELPEIVPGLAIPESPALPEDAEGNSKGDNDSGVDSGSETIESVVTRPSELIAAPE